MLQSSKFHKKEKEPDLLESGSFLYIYRNLPHIKHCLPVDTIIEKIGGEKPLFQKGEQKMSKPDTKKMDAAKYVVCGMVIGSAVGTAVSVMLKSKHKPQGFREKAAAAMDTVGVIMQNMADFTR